ncbi:anti sigma factor C-terminal domain-containing protein [Paenibacillus pabuli]|uniref:anti sigma factor C-terminal domain-containing protein n=1 Tax=Paenibacillus pabuli TaxID=1472 RepID=UPI0007838D2E|nr:anti sigma factor C-terminal domain-containing protein [Paenibacillus pabuli]MEC0128987.1 anti sigma factor C-terminal domain-containing protein [Paenibacillus pabuli]
MNGQHKENDSVNVSKMVRKAKRATTIRTVAISLLVSLIAFFGVMLGNQYLTSWSYNRANNSEQIMNLISGPDEKQTGQVNYSGFLNGTFQYYTAKVIEGVPIPWADRKISYKVFPFINFVTFGGDTSQSVSLQDENMKKQGYEYTRSYNGLNGQREMLFYIPKVDYNGKILNDLPLLQEMDQDKLVEMAISFDKDYSLSEVKQMIPPGVTQSWYWVDTYDNKAFYDPYIDGNGNKSYATPDVEDWVKGFGISHSDSSEVSEKTFLEALEQGVQLKGHYQYEFNRIYNYLKKDKAKPDESDIRILGAVVTGTAKELQVLNGQFYVRGITLGAVVDKF